MTWFRRGSQPAAPGEGDDGQPDESPAALRAWLADIVRFLNRSAGRLPVEAVVIARQVTDLLGEVVATADDGELDAYALVQWNGIAGDYLPTTLRAYMDLDPAVTGRPGPRGRTPREALREQLESLREAAGELLAAARAHDVDALFTQGSFLRTKFTRSDLDL